MFFKAVEKILINFSTKLNFRIIVCFINVKIPYFKIFYLYALEFYQKIISFLVNLNKKLFFII